MHWAIILLFSTYLMTVHSQTWNGTYIVDSTCIKTACCCLSNRIVLTQSSSTVLAFNTSLNGSVCLGYPYYSGVTTYPNGYIATITISIITLTITMSSDSRTLAITNSLGSLCNSGAVRDVIVVETTTMHGNAVQQYISIIILFSLAFLSCIIRI